MFLILLAGLQSLPEEPFEAARVDGAGPWRTFVDHTLPMLRPVLAVAIVLRTIDAFRTFDQVYVLTHGGPGEATELISIYGYDTSFQFQQTATPRRMFADGALLVLALRAPAVRLHAAAGDDVMRAPAQRRCSPVAGIVALLPIYWMAATSLKSNREITQDGTLYPHGADVRQLPQPVLGAATSAPTSPTRSAITALSVLDLARARLARAPTRSPASVCASASSATSASALLTLRILPPIVILVPVYLLIVERCTCSNTWLGLIVIYTALQRLLRASG